METTRRGLEKVPPVRPKKRKRKFQNRRNRLQLRKSLVSPHIHPKQKRRKAKTRKRSPLRRRTRRRSGQALHPRRAAALPWLFQGPKTVMGRVRAVVNRKCRARMVE